MVKHHRVVTQRDYPLRNKQPTPAKLQAETDEEAHHRRLEQEALEATKIWL